MKKPIVLLFMLIFLSCLFLPLINVNRVNANTETYSFQASSDAYVLSTSADSNYGSESTLKTGLSEALDVYRSYISFNTSSITSNSSLLVSATLKLYCSAASATDRDYNVTVVTEAWDASTLTWNTQPTGYGESYNPTWDSTTGWISVNVTSLYQSNGTLSFRIMDSTENASTTQYTFNSAEAANNTPILEVTVEEGPYFFKFYGVYDETTGVYSGGCNVTAYYTGYIAETFEVIGEKLKGFTVLPAYFSYDLSPCTREYWCDVSDANNTSLYIYNGDTTSYVINFLDFTGILQNYPLIQAQIAVNGSAVTVEKRKADVEGSIAMSLVNGKKYSIIISDGNSSYTFGDLLMTSTTGVQLVLKGSQWPKETLLTQKNVHIYATRNFTSTAIEIVYDDALNLTTSVIVTLKYGNGSTAYTTTKTDQSFTVSYSADNATTYYLETIITHSTYGELLYNQIFLGENTNAPPFSLGWMGNLSFDTAYIIPALLILFVAGCFSALNAEVGAILVSLMAIILTIMGWIPIPAGALVAAMFFAILMALMYNKRGIQVIG